MKNGILLLTFIGCFSFAHGQPLVIATHAGTGIAGFSGDGGPALTAQFNNIRDIGSDATGNMYVCDASNYRIRKINAAGVVTTIGGTGATTGGFGGDGGPATAANLGAIYLEANAAGDVFLSDFGVNRIRKIDGAGIINTIAGSSSSSGYSGDGGPATAAHLNNPCGIAFDATGNLFFCDRNNNVIRKINTSGIITTVAGTGGSGYSGDGGPATTAQLIFPNDIAVDAFGNLFFSEDGNHVIRKVTPSGIISTVAGNGTMGYGGDGGPATAAQLLLPKSIALDAVGNIYISTGYYIRKVDASSGIISTIAGTGTPGYSGDGGLATAADIYAGGLIVTPSGKIFAAGSAKIRLLYPNHIPYFPAGTTQTKTVCGPAMLDTVLAIVDSETVQPLTWGFASGPHHGTLSAASYSGSTSGGMVMPAGIFYTPTTGYRGLDTIVALISDGVNVGTTTIYLTVGIPLPGTITGSDTICVGDTTTLHNVVTTGTWSASNAKATISTTGFVSASTVGRDTIRYMASNACGSDTATLYLTIRPAGTCITEVKEIYTAMARLTLQPNPSHGSCTFNLSSPTEEALTITITNMLGQRVKEVNWQTNRPLELETDLPAGVYVLSAATEGERYMVRMVVE